MAIACRTAGAPEHAFSPAGIRPEISDRSIAPIDSLPLRILEIFRQTCSVAVLILPLLHSSLLK
jgi:hypothetical protein